MTKISLLIFDFFREMGVSYGPKDPYETYVTRGLNLPYYTKIPPLCLVAGRRDRIKLADDIKELPGGNLGFYEVGVGTIFHSHA